MYYQDGKGSSTQMDEAVRAVTGLVNHETHAFNSWTEYHALYAQNLPTYQTAPTNAIQRDLTTRTEKEHSYRFEYPRLLRSAFMHPSIPKGQEGVPSYQRLEFLGDALLDMTAVNHLARSYNGKDPGWLTEHKMAMVSNRFLGALCVRLGFHRHLHHSHPSLLTQITDYVVEIQEAEEKSEGRRDYWTTTVRDAPKVSA